MKTIILATAFCAFTIFALFVNLNEVGDTIISLLLISYSLFPSFVYIFSSETRPKVLPTLKGFFAPLCSGVIVGLFICGMTYYWNGDYNFLKTIHFHSLNMFLIYFLPILLVFSFSLIGQELFWRGYFWEIVKKYSYLGVWLVALFWCIWMLPGTLMKAQLNSISLWIAIIDSTVMQFLITPILLSLRVKYDSVLSPTIFYASLTSCLVAFYTYLSVPSQALNWWLYLIVFAYGAILRSYSPKLYKFKSI